MANRPSARLKSWETDTSILWHIVSPSSIVVRNMPYAVMMHAIEVRRVVTPGLGEMSFVLSAAIHLLEILEIDFVILQDAIVVDSTARLLLVELVFENANLVRQCLQLLVEG